MRRLMLGMIPLLLLSQMAWADMQDCSRIGSYIGVQACEAHNTNELLKQLIEVVKEKK